MTRTALVEQVGQTFFIGAVFLCGITHCLKFRGECFRAMHGLMKKFGMSMSSIFFEY